MLAKQIVLGDSRELEPYTEPTEASSFATRSRGRALRFAEQAGRRFARLGWPLFLTYAGLTAVLLLVGCSDHQIATVCGNGEVKDAEVLSPTDDAYEVIVEEDGSQRLAVEVDAPCAETVVVSWHLWGYPEDTHLVELECDPRGDSLNPALECSGFIDLAEIGETCPSEPMLTVVEVEAVAEDGTVGSVSVTVPVEGDPYP